MRLDVSLVTGGRPELPMDDDVGHRQTGGEIAA